MLRGVPASPVLSGGGVGSPITPLDEPAEVEQLRKALARQVQISERAGQGKAPACRVDAVERQSEVGAGVSTLRTRSRSCSRTGQSHTVVQSAAAAAIPFDGPTSGRAVHRACADHGSVAGMAATGLRPQQPVARAGSVGVTALAAHLDEVLSTAAWEQAAPKLKNIEWLVHPTLAKRQKPTRRGAQSTRRRRARKKQAGERQLPVSAASSREKPQCRGSTGSRRQAK